ncbi:hypothetical protein GCM10007190_07250 [Macrococcus hajekii]|nr:hypothetical protein GCM10007190_07250 [Macrococcus hajekii]
MLDEISLPYDYIILESYQTEELFNKTVLIYRPKEQRLTLVREMKDYQHIIFHNQ